MKDEKHILNCHLKQTKQRKGATQQKRLGILIDAIESTYSKIIN